MKDSQFSMSFRSAQSSKNGFIFALLMFFGISVYAQFTIDGVVKDAESGEALIGVRVILKDGAVGALTDMTGKFTFECPKAPPVTLRLTYVGYDTLDFEITSLDKSAKIKLVPGGIQFDAVEIIGQSISEKQKKSALTIESMGSIAIRETPASDFYAALGNLKGVDVTSASLGFKVVNTRGFNSTSPVRSLQIIDGVDNQSPGLNFSLGNFLGSSELDVQKVDMVVGASSAFYGPNAFNGVISMTTKSPFMHPGLSVLMKVGERNLFETAMRWAQVFKDKKGEDKFAYKINLFFLKANDWEATNADATPQSKVGTDNPGSYDAVNRYGDENLTDGINNASSLSGRAQTPGLGIWHRTGYWEKDLVDYNTENIKASAAFHYKIKSDLELILASNFGSGTTVYQGDNRFSLRDILFFQNRLELRKKDKFFIRAYATNEDAGKSYDAVFTAFKLQDAVKNDNDWSKDYRNYWTININDQHVRKLPGFPALGFPYPYDLSDSLLLVNNDSIVAYHNETRAYADGVGNPIFDNLPRYEPGTAAFDSAFNSITSKTSFLNGGTRFWDRSALYHVHGEYKITPTFTDNITVGGNARVYRPNSRGTIFQEKAVFDTIQINQDTFRIDTSFTRITNVEFGLYAGIEKKLMDDRLILNGAARLDKNQNFNYLISPAASAVYSFDENNILRFSFSAAIRNPTLTDQYLQYNVGRAVLLGNVNGYDSLVTISSLQSFFSTQNTDTLDYFDVPPIRPEKVKSIEIGYRTILWERLYIDGSYYFSFYKDFIGYRIGADITVDHAINRALVNRIYRVSANSPDVVTTQGFSVGANYFFAKKYSLNGNYSWNALNKRGSDDPIIPAFNTPAHKFNIGVSGRDVGFKFGNFESKNWGFNVNYKWVKGFLFEGSPQFTGEVPTYDMFDAQINKRIPSIHTTFKLGVSNLFGLVPFFREESEDLSFGDRLGNAFNNETIQVYGGASIGRLTYFSIRLDLDDLGKSKK